MADKIYIVEDRQFRTLQDYNKAEQDKKLIDSIRQRVDFGNKFEVSKLLRELEEGKYSFHTILGQDFLEEVTECYEKLKATEASGAQSGKKSTKNTKKNARKSATQSARRKFSKKHEEQIDKYVQEELRKMEKRRKLLRLVSCLTAVVCLGYFSLYLYQSYRSQSDNSDLAALKNPIFNYGWEEESEEEPVINYTKDDKEVPEILEEYKKMYNLNKRLIGWLKIADIGIDNPVMQTNNNEFYLDHNFYQKKDQNGTLFMDKDCDVLKPSTNWIVYGHHMKNGQMFGNLIKYESEDYYKKHKTFTFDTIYEKGTYEIMYVFRSKVYSEEEIVFKYYQFTDALSEQEFDSYMQEMSKMSLYDTGVTAKYTDQLLTLSTCDYYTEAGRFVVVAKRTD